MKYLCIIFFILPVILPAQERESIVERRVVPEQEWKKAAGELDYSRDLPGKPKPKKDRSRPDRTRSSDSDWTAMSQFWGNFFQILAILIACAAIGYGIYWIIRQPRNRRIARDGAEITLDNLDAYIHETDLERFLREALAQQNYPLAVRIYFLQIIKELSQNGAINWSKEKTNRDYLREMREHPLANPFREATRTFEYTWYGNMSLNRADFERLEPGFKALLARI
ncbi:MAG: DUF4129 domain-containing protein [Thermoanaerobaculia bacterium]|nr:DUF4129 domain-containing protein [Thermoanaerobaculia bacterium]